jgi:hypothetical protein
MGGRGHKGKLPIYEYDEKDGLFLNWNIDWPEGKLLVKLWDSNANGIRDQSVKWLRKKHADPFAKFKYSAVARGWNTLKNRDKVKAERDNSSQPTVCKFCDNLLYSIQFCL